ncbi:MAG: HD domain-containing protein, partial [Alistipes sp.]|nr:HD domain-containing protein [Alistipes sp.]
MTLARYDKFRTLVRETFSEASARQVDEALVYAAEHLSGQMRYDGRPMLDHAVSVADIVLQEIGLGRNSTIASILHDVVRLGHKELSAEEFLALTTQIEERFGKEVVGITVGLANISSLKLKVAHEQAENFRDLIV